MDTYLGTVAAFGFNFAPYGWAQCQGQLMQISQNAALFSLLGTAYGGNGTSTFGLPNLQAVAAIGAGQGPGLSDYVMGESGGTTSAVLNANNLPAHSHTLTVKINVTSGRPSSASPVNNFPADISTGTAYAPAPVAGIVMKGNANIVLNPAGGNSPVDIQRPGLVANYCIALQGYFPQRP